MKHARREIGAIRAENVRLVNKPLTETHAKQGSITLGSRAQSARSVLAERADARPPKRPKAR